MDRSQIPKASAIRGDESKLAAVKQRIDTALQRHAFDCFELNVYLESVLIDTPLQQKTSSLSQSFGTASAPVDTFAPISKLALQSLEPIDWAQITGSQSVANEARWCADFSKDHSIRRALSVPLMKDHNLIYVWHFASTANEPSALDENTAMTLCGLAYLAAGWLPKPASFYRHAAPPQNILSDRQIEVLQWSKEGKSYSEIAAIMGISSKTVDYHMSNAMRRLGVNQKIMAIVAAAKLGIIRL